MNNLKKILLSTFILSTLAGGSCFSMGRGGQIHITCDDRKEFESLRGKLNEFIIYLQLLNKVQPGSQVASTIASFLLQPCSIQDSSYKYKEQIKALADYLKGQNLITDTEYNKFKAMINW